MSHGQREYICLLCRSFDRVFNFCLLCRDLSERKFELLGMFFNGHPSLEDKLLEVMQISEPGCHERGFAVNFNRCRKFALVGIILRLIRLSVLLSEKRIGLCALRHGIQISMEAILACHPVRLGGSEKERKGGRNAALVSSCDVCLSPGSRPPGCCQSNRTTTRNG